MYKLLSLIVSIISISTFAQEISKYGKIPKEHLEMAIYSQDSSAEAVILFDDGDIGFEYHQTDGWKLLFDRHIAIKILSKEGYDWADHEIKLYHDGASKEIVSKLKGITYNLVDGKVSTSKLTKTSIFSEETNEYWNTEKFTMPDVRVGSVIEFSYRIISDFYFNLRSWDFQSSIPTMYSQLTTVIPEYFNFRLITQGYYPFYKNEIDESFSKIRITTANRVGTTVVKTGFESNEVEFKNNKQTLAAKDIPGMKEEAFTSTVNNYRMKVDFELQYTEFPGSGYKDYRGSWAALNKQFLENQYFGRAIGHVGNIRNELEILSNLPSEEEKLTSAYNLIRAKLNWNGFYSKYSSGTLNSALKSGEGNIADINLALTGALREVGLEAEPVLISTRSNGLIRKNFPLSSQFNYVVCVARIGENEILLDASSGLPPGYLPTRCLNGEGFVVSKLGGRWVSLSNNADYRKMYTTNIEIVDGEKISADIKVEKVMYASFGDRSEIINKGEDSRIKEIQETFNWDVNSYEVANVKDVSEPLVENYSVITSDKIEKAGNLLLIDPLFIGEQTENPFKMKSREYPVDFIYPRYYAYQGKITIPEGYVIDELPAPAALALPNRKGRFMFSIGQIENKLTVTSLIQIKEGVFLPAEYPYIKEFFSQIVEKHSEQIVLKKL